MTDELIREDTLFKGLEAEDIQLLKDRGFAVPDENNLCMECGRENEHWATCWVPGYNHYLATELRGE